MRPIGKSGQAYLLGLNYNENNNLYVKFCYKNLDYFHGIILFDNSGNIVITKVKRQINRELHLSLIKCMRQNDLTISDKELSKVKFSEEYFYNEWLKSRMIFNRSV